MDYNFRGSWFIDIFTCVVFCIVFYYVLRSFWDYFSQKSIRQYCQKLKDVIIKQAITMSCFELAV